MVERSTLMEARGSIPGTDRPKSFKQIAIAPLPNAKAIGVSVTGPRIRTLKTTSPCHSKCGPFKNPHG